jgi:hypothetical protein
MDDDPVRGEPSMSEREWLRLHVEAVWGIALPPLHGTEVELALDRALPPWSLYQASWSQERLTIWAPGIPPAQRTHLLDQVQGAGVTFDHASGMRCEVEVVFQQRHPPRLPSGAGLPLVRRLTEADAVLLDQFEPGEAAYYLNTQRAPCIGVVVQGGLVSVAHSSRRTPEACELGIFTLPAARRQGYARTATVAWSEAIRQEGLQPLYSASASNTASLQLAASAGYVALIQGVYGPVAEREG